MFFFNLCYLSLNHFLFPMKLLLFILCLSASFSVTRTLSLDGLTLLSLVNQWTSVPPSFNSSWKSSDSTPCSWPGIRCDHYKNVVSLNLTASHIFGRLGPEIGQLTRLQILLLASNGFSGTIPPELGNCSMLEYIDLSENHLSGNIPPEIGNCKYLKSLLLYSNQLEGAIPNELGRLSKLEDLELYFNLLTGEIPLTIWMILSLKHVLLHNNSLSGKLPSEMTELKHLKNISLFDNQFFGPIPQSLGINSSLVKLDLMNNKFTGGVPPNLCFGKQLLTLSLGLNQLQGGIPQDLGRCATLVRLVLNENNLSGSLPEFEGSQNLIYMDMSKNNISGVIPSSLGNCTNLTALILSTNNITGPVPFELGNLVNLQALNLAHNNLEGPLPQQLSYCTKMLTFDVGFNFLNGSYPSSMKSWTGLTKLILRENHFTGVIPSFLSEYDQLSELQLGGNMFVGRIPTSIGSLQNLLYGLNLSANKLTGEIPLELGKLQKLQSLDISLNNLTGGIHVLGELSSLMEVNISYNSFVGPLPEWKIQHLNLSLSSFLGNPGLCVYCSTSICSSCAKKPCDSESTDHKGSRRSILFIALGFVGFVICLSCVLLFYDHRSRQRLKEEEELVAYHDKQDRYDREFRERSVLVSNTDCEEPQALYSNDEVDFRIIDILNATENLHDQYIIGQGGHGIVYKAELDSGVFAVKKVKFGRNNRRKLNWIKEIEMTRKIRHQNVARCLGFWTGEEYGLTISKYKENGSLHDVLHEHKSQPPLAWNVRYKIAIGIAKGLAYLHHDCDPPVLHRDIKPKNILLDSDMQPCIIDFGISIALNQSSATMNMRSTYHLGTPGFMAPETPYAIVLSNEFDVYSFGVVLLELITGKKVLDSSFLEEETTLVGWFKSVWRRTSELEEIVDSSIARELSDLNVKVQVIKVLLVALICTQKHPRKRLKMLDVVEFFETPTDPGIFVRHDTAQFHLGIFLTAAGAPNLFEEKFEILANGGSFSVPSKVMFEVAAKSYNLNMISTRTRGVVSKVQLHSGLICSERKVTFSGNKGSSSSMCREIEILEKIRHRNIVRMVEYMLRVHYGIIWYEYMPNGNLNDVLHEMNPPPFLKWNVRYKIARGIAHGLVYLHYDCHLPIVHCAIKPRNIVLGYDMEPRIVDFGFAQFVDQSSSVSATHGYISPAKTREADVYSYGIVLLQLITRKKAVDPSFMNGTEIGIWVRSRWRETGDINTIVDSSLAEEALDSDVFEQVTKVLLLALRCTEMDPYMRPTMEDVMGILKTDQIEKSHSRS